MQRGADRLKMPPVPESIFVDAVEQVVEANKHWVPPTGKGAMYVRPLLMGSGPVLGVSPAPSYTFLIYVTPVGPYFKGGMSAIDLLISEHHHRAAPGGSRRQSHWQLRPRDETEQGSKSSRLRRGDLPRR